MKRGRMLVKGFDEGQKRRNWAPNEKINSQRAHGPGLELLSAPGLSGPQLINKYLVVYLANSKTYYVKPRQCLAHGKICLIGVGVGFDTRVTSKKSK